MVDFCRKINRGLLLPKSTFVHRLQKISPLYEIKENDVGSFAMLPDTSFENPTKFPVFLKKTFIGPVLPPHQQQTLPYLTPIVMFTYFKGCFIKLKGKLQYS